MSDILKEVQDFLEDMHIADAYETVRRSQELHEKVKAARAQGGQGAEPVAYMFSDDYGRIKIVSGKETAEHWCPPGETVTPLYTHPQPTQQASVPDEAVNLARKWLGMVEGGFLHNDDITKMAEALVAAPQPEGDGWVRCEDRLPTADDADFAGRVMFWCSGVGAGIAGPNARDFKSGHWTHWKPTGLKRPQPPQEGSGDE